MQLGINEPIYSGCIYYSKELKQGAVYMLNGYGDDRVVVKIDSASYTDNDVRFLGGVMAQIDAAVRPIPLTPTEFQEMERWTDETMPTADLMQSAANLKWALNTFRTQKWVKMRALRLLILDEAATKMGEGDKTDVRVIAASLNAPGGLEKLGSIIAADFFIGNRDRFVWPPPGSSWPKENGERLKALQNVGNVFVSIDSRQNKGVPSGLDILDPGNPFKNITRKMDLDEEWMGLLLGAEKNDDRSQFAHDVIADLNYILGPRNRRFKFLQQERLGPQASNRLLVGMKNGADRIRASLSRYMKGHGALPTGVGHRIERLKWKL